MENSKNIKESNTLDIHGIIQELLKYWYLFAIALFIAMAIGYLFIKFTAPEYMIRSKMMLTTPESRRGETPTEFLQGFELYQEERSLQNEILVLHSTPLIKNVIKDIDYSVSYFVKEDYIPRQIYLVFRQLYKDAPFEVIINKEFPQPVDVKFFVRILNQEQFSISIDESDVKIYDYLTDKIIRRVGHLALSKVYKFGEEIKGPDYSFKVLLNDEYGTAYKNKDLYFSFNNLEKVTAQFKSNIEISQSGAEATIVDISFTSPNASLGVDFVNGLTNAYMQRNLNKKNYIAITTIDYIDQQLAAISDSLYYSERELQDFRSRFQVMDINSKAGRVYQKLQELEAQKTELTRNLSFYQALDQYFEIHKDSSYLRAPSAMGIADDLLNNQIQELSSLNSEKNALIKSNQLRNPRLEAINIRILDLKKSINENVKFIIRSTEAILNQINEDISIARYEETKLPQTERRLIEIERRYNLNDAVYTFLLQKRAEAQIAKASNLPDSEIIEPAMYSHIAFPKKSFVYAVALLLGLLIPGLYIFLRNFFNVKIIEIDEISRMFNIPVLGYILHNDKPTPNVLVEYPTAGIAESFRSFRAKLLISSDEINGHVVLFTSTFEKEGKSFTAMNLATSLALFGKKTVLVGFDLRKPSVFFKEYGTPDFLGLSAYLTNKVNIEDIIIHTKIDNLDFINSGPVPANPTELFASPKTGELFTVMRKKYDYIILDTSPMIPVADVYHLLKYTDSVVFVVRQNHTPKKPFILLMNEIITKESVRKYLIFNDVVSRGKLDNYRYGYGYYQKEPADNLLKTMMNRLKRGRYGKVKSTDTIK